MHADVCNMYPQNTRSILMFNPGNLCGSDRTSVEVSNEQDIFQNYWKTKRNSDKTTLESYTVSQKDRNETFK